MDFVVRLSESDESKFPLKFCQLKNVSVLKQACGMLDPQKKYINGMKDDSPQSKNYSFICEQLNDKLLPAKIEFMISVAENLYVSF